MLTALRQVVQKVNAAKNLEHALEELVLSVKEAMQTEVCSVYLRQPSGSFVLMATEGLNKEAIGNVSLNEDEGLVGLVASRAEPINLEDAENHPRYRYFPETGEERYASFMGSPIIHHGEVLGVLVVQQRRSRRFEEEEGEAWSYLAPDPDLQAKFRAKFKQKVAARYTPVDGGK